MDIPQNFLDMLEFYRNNPIIALEELLNIELAVPQRVIFNSMWNHKFTIVTAGRGNGKSFLLAAFASLRGMLFPGTRIGLLAPSFRQCVVGSTYIITENGFCRAGDIKDNPLYLVSDVGKYPCSAIYRNVPEPTKRVTLTNGLKIEGALDHKVLVVDTTGDMVFKSLTDVSTDDYACIKAGSLCFGDEVYIDRFKEKFVPAGNLRRENIPSILDEDFSYFLGLVVGDGCVTNENFIHFCNCDTGLLDKYMSLCKRYFGRYTQQDKGGGLVNISIGSKLGFLFLCNIGLGGKRSEEKVVPDIILRAPREIQVSFIRGLFDTAGCIYFNKKVSHSYKIHIAFVSECLIDQVQLMLLNLGITSVKGVNKNNNRKNFLYFLEISNKESVLLFRYRVGFGCKYKDEKLNSVCECIMSTDIYRSNKDFVPGAGYKLEPVVSKIRTAGARSFEYLKLWSKFNGDSNFIGSVESVTRGYIRKIVDYCRRNGISDDCLEYLDNILCNNIYFYRVGEITTGFDYTYDFTVEDVHRYLSNGFISHNSKICFEEVRRIWFAAPIFKEATSGRPTFQSDRCILNFRALGTTPPSLIEADPLGTGEKIRGLRMHIILVDEFAQMPEEIFSAVVKPMAATSSSPMERVKQVKRMKMLTDRGELVEDSGGANKIIVASSAFYKFNHMYKNIEQYNKFIRDGSKDYAVCSVNYLDMPPGFMNDDIIKEARDTMASSLFKMEYLAIWESDSDGVFKASLLESRKLPPGDSVKLEGELGKEYVVACDPARTSDFCSVVVVELGERNKVVNAYKYHKFHFPQMADMIMQVCGKYNVVRLVMDSQGGGLAIKDLLADSLRYGNNIIIDMDDEEYRGVDGRRILQMFNPAPSTNADANFATLNLLEQGRLWFSGVPLSGNEEDESSYELITELVRQMLNIVMTQTKSGTIHFDVPSGEGHGAQKKDLYSALIYAAHKAYQLRLEREPTNVLWGSGIVTQRGGPSSNPQRPMLVSSFAVLKKADK